MVKLCVVRGQNPTVPIVSAVVVSVIRLHLWILRRLSSVCLATLQYHTVCLELFEGPRGATVLFKQLRCQLRTTLAPLLQK